MSDAIQIFPLEEVRERAELAQPGAKCINIFQGHIRESGGRNILTMAIKRDENGNWPQQQLDYVKRLKGNFTAVILPAKEFFYISSSSSHQPPPLFYSPFDDYQENQFQPPGNLNEIVQQLLKLQKENEALKLENKELKEELNGLESGADKFSYALEKLFYRVAPSLGLMDKPNNYKPMDGTEKAEWQTVDLSGNDEDTIERALGVLYLAFGDESILNFARRLQHNPNLVVTLKQMI